jgi:hypothetical protein
LIQPSGNTWKKCGRNKHGRKMSATPITP